MTLRELLRSVDVEKVLHVLVKEHPEEKRQLDSYRSAYKMVF